jgi:hypothetical protein
MAGGSMVLNGTVGSGGGSPGSAVAGACVRTHAAGKLLARAVCGVVLGSARMKTIDAIMYANELIE